VQRLKPTVTDNIREIAAVISVLKRKKLKLMAALRLLGKKHETTAAGYISLHVLSSDISSISAQDSKDIIAFAELIDVDDSDLEFVLAQFQANGLRKQAAIRLALAQLILNCLSADKRCKLAVRWMAENIAEDEGKGPVPEQNDIGS
jgi:hypothetical protein